jgi:hypothetical protein
VITPDEQYDEPDDEGEGIDVVVPKVYDWVRASMDLRMILQDWGVDIPKQVVCCMGDNVTHNAAVASSLGVRLGKCQSHAYSLIVKNSYNYIPLLHILSSETGSFIFAGGSHKRCSSLYNIGLDPIKMRYYPTRSRILWPKLTCELKQRVNKAFIDALLKKKLQEPKVIKKIETIMLLISFFDWGSPFDDLVSSSMVVHDGLMPIAMMDNI